MHFAQASQLCYSQTTCHGVEGQLLYVPCEGMMINDRFSAGVLFDYRREFKMRVSMSNLKMFAKHIYWQPSAVDGSSAIRNVSNNARRCLQKSEACARRGLHFVVGTSRDHVSPVRTSILSVLLCTSFIFQVSLFVLNFDIFASLVGLAGFVGLPT